MPIDLSAADVRALTTKPGWQSYDTDADHHRRCKSCQARITITPNNGEVGHGYRCPERPDTLLDNEPAASVLVRERTDDNPIVVIVDQPEADHFHIPDGGRRLIDCGTPLDLDLVEYVPLSEALERGYEPCQRLGCRASELLGPEQHADEVIADGGHAACPTCGGPIIGSTVTGPDTEYANPCGCQIPARGGGHGGD